MISAGLDLKNIAKLLLKFMFSIDISRNKRQTAERGFRPNAIRQAMKINLVEQCMMYDPFNSPWSLAFTREVY